jgi:hypothetical protein
MSDEEQCCFSSSWESGEGLRFVNPILFPPPFYPSVMMDVFFFFLLSLDYTTC